MGGFIGNELFSSIYLNDASSIGFTSTNPLTITEHNEKNKDERVANIIPKYGQEHDCHETEANGDRNRR